MGLAGSTPTWGLDEVDVVGDMGVDGVDVDATGGGRGTPVAIRKYGAISVGLNSQLAVACGIARSNEMAEVARISRDIMIPGIQIMTLHGILSQCAYILSPCGAA